VLARRGEGAFRHDAAALVAAGALETAGASKATRYFIKLPGWKPADK
jgi:hypothetical protein